jgi:CheY-like chemotaxis protein
LLKLLVIEDEEGARQVVSRLLAVHGYDVVEASDGEEALALFRVQADIAMVLTDLTLPGMSGWEVAAEVKKLSPDTPVIVLSGWDIKNGDEHIRNSGVDRVLSKPVKIKDILEALTGLTGGKQ